MAKTKTVFFCQNCGTSYPKWQGQCQSCKSWNTIVEEVVEKPTSNEVWKATKSLDNTSTHKTPLLLSDIKIGTKQYRLDTKSSEFNRVLGGGLVPGSMILLGGEPGIGKSTLLLQICLNLPFKSLYVSGEESIEQIKMRAVRMPKSSSDLCYLYSGNKTHDIFKQITKIKPEILIIDSIQTLSTDSIDAAPGSVSQIRECTNELLYFAKKTHTPVLLIGHITKDGHLAGPKVLEHLVDTVLQFEGDRNFVYRILRSQKNRFGSTSELGIYQMQSNGLEEVHNPSELFLSKKDEAHSGTTVATIMEGMRAILIEIQALVSSAVYGTPQRSTTGYSTKRLNMLLAVLEKRAGFKLGAKDVFLNITGGMDTEDPATDLAVIAAILSSNEDEPIDDSFCFAAEVGLTGEIRPISKIEQRINEAQKLGFTKMFISKYSKFNEQNYHIELIKISKIEELINALFEV